MLLSRDLPVFLTCFCSVRRHTDTHSSPRQKPEAIVQAQLQRLYVVTLAPPLAISVKPVIKVGSALVHFHLF